jgi:hypothetical protein
MPNAQLFPLFLAAATLAAAEPPTQAFCHVQQGANQYQGPCRYDEAGQSLFIAGDGAIDADVALRAEPYSVAVLVQPFPLVAIERGALKILIVPSSRTDWQSGTTFTGTGRSFLTFGPSADLLGWGLKFAWGNHGE